jgi:hypothetical protein
MSTSAKIAPLSRRKVKVKSQDTAENSSIENAERQKRLQAIDLIFGMWKGRDDAPKDGLDFQQEMRSEW